MKTLKELVCDQCHRREVIELWHVVYSRWTDVLTVKGQNTTLCPECTEKFKALGAEGRSP